jgi:hypothetical protein
MMNIQEFIQTDILLPRIKRNGVLVVYDPEHRYRELCQDLKVDGLHVIDATESSIESRETALKVFGNLGALIRRLPDYLFMFPLMHRYPMKTGSETHSRCIPFAATYSRKVTAMSI